MSFRSMQVRWVIGRYDPASKVGKNVIAHAEAGVGYFILNKNRKATEDVIVGFSLPTNKPIPHHLSEATSEQQQKLDSLWQKRHIQGGR